MKGNKLFSDEIAQKIVDRWIEEHKTIEVTDNEGKTIIGTFVPSLDKTV